MARYARNIFYVGFAEQASKGTAVAPVYFPQYFDGAVAITPETTYTHYTPAGGQYPNLSLVESIVYPLSFTALATPRIFAFLSAAALGKEQIKGTQPGTPVATTLNGAIIAGATSATLTSGTGFAQGDYIQFVDVSDTFEDTGEIVTIATITTNDITFAACKYAHASGDVAEKVVLPIQHKAMFAARESMPWFSLEASTAYNSGQTDPIIPRYADCRILSTTISGTAGKPILIAPSIHAISMAKQSSETAESFESNNPLMYHQGTFTLDSSADTNIPNFSLVINNIADESDFTNAITRQDIPVTGRSATLSWTLKLEDGTRFLTLI